MKTRIDLAEHFNKLGFKKGAEIGVAGGTFSEKLCKAIPGLELYCVDPWDTYHENRRGGGKDNQQSNLQLARERLVKYNVHFIRDFSMNVVGQIKHESLDFVFIDGNHDFDYVMEDIIAWSRKVKRGGIVSGHDYYHFHNSGVIEAVNAYISAHKIDLNLTEWNDSEYRDDRCPCFWWVKK